MAFSLSKTLSQHKWPVFIKNNGIVKVILSFAEEGRFRSKKRVSQKKADFAASKWGSLCCEMALVCQNRLRNFKIPCEMELWLRNWEFSRFVASQPFRNCEMGVPVLRSGTRVPNLGSQLRKFSQRRQLSCEMISQRMAAFAETRWFCSEVLISQKLRNLADPCFCSDWLPFNFFTFSPTWDHSKRLNYI